MNEANVKHGGAGFLTTLIGSTFLMGSSFAAGKILLVQGFQPMVLVGWRFMLAAFAILPFMLLFSPRGRTLAPLANPRVLGAVVLLGLLQTTAVQATLYLAMQSVSASAAAILLFTNPIWVAVLGRIFLGEVLSPWRAAALAIGVAGVALALGVGEGSSSGTLTGEIIGLGSAFCWAAATILNKRMRLPLGPWALTFWQMLVGALALLAIAFALGDRWPDHTSPKQWAWFVWLAIPASAGAYGLWYVALGKGGATKASSYLFMAPLFAVVVSCFFFESPLTWAQAIGGVLVGLSLWMINNNIELAGRRREMSDRQSR